MRLVDALVFAAAAAAAALQSEGPSLDVLEEVKTAVEGAVAMLHRRKDASSKILYPEFPVHEFYLLNGFVKDEARIIYQSPEPLSIAIAGRLLKPAKEFPALAVALHSALADENIKAAIMWNDDCWGVRSSIVGLQGALNDLRINVYELLPGIRQHDGYRKLESFTRSLAETSSLLGDCQPEGLDAA
ncbi:hypothetical protein RJ55_03322 [Drechmeria coniospora]|nr:hypothetical protein RJ55_03322 [Drechmeria coniospora]